LNQVVTRWTGHSFASSRRVCATLGGLVLWAGQAVGHIVHIRFQVKSICWGLVSSRSIWLVPTSRTISAATRAALEILILPSLAMYTDGTTFRCCISSLGADITACIGSIVSKSLRAHMTVLAAGAHPRTYGSITCGRGVGGGVRSSTTVVAGLVLILAQLVPTQWTVGTGVGRCDVLTAAAGHRVRLTIADRVPWKVGVGARRGCRARGADDARGLCSPSRLVRPRDTSAAITARTIFAWRTLFQAVAGRVRAHRRCLAAGAEAAFRSRAVAGLVTTSRAVVAGAAARVLAGVALDGRGIAVALPV
jgi:hypothetical protein